LEPVLNKIFPSILATFALSLPALGDADAWKYQTFEDKMTSKERNLAYLTSDNSLDLEFPYKADYNYGRLVVRGSAVRPEVYVSITKGQILCPGYGDGCTISARFDQAPPIRFRAVGPDDYSSTAFFIRDAKRFVSLASKAKKILVQFRMYNAGTQTLEFSPEEPLVWGSVAKKK
jgi:hypothetical protein